jgi:hypothetical protein
LVDFEVPMVPVWHVGDTRELDDSELQRLRESDAYESYDQTYIIESARWKVVGEIHHANGHSAYTLECIAVGE